MQTNITACPAPQGQLTIAGDPVTRACRATISNLVEAELR